MAPLQILFKLEDIYNELVDIQFRKVSFVNRLVEWNVIFIRNQIDIFGETSESDGCMVKTVIRRKQQFHDIVSKISGKNISGMICAPLETFTWAPELLDG